MKLWTFLFPSPSCRQASARVAAPDKLTARMLLAGAIGGLPSDAICDYAGEDVALTSQGVLTVSGHDGPSDPRSGKGGTNRPVPT